MILNTCHIREKATEKMYSELGKYAKSEKIIVVAGCVSQAEGSVIFSRAPYVNIVVGPQSFHLLPGLIRRYYNGENHLIELEFEANAKFDEIEANIIHTPKAASHFVSIQEGCDKFCTFCVVPYTRGPEISRPIENILQEIEYLANNGTKEITLLGQNVNAYHGRDANNKIHDLASLIEKVAKFSSIERIRYTTSHPIDFNDRLIEIHGVEEKLMPFIHLPVQSGSNHILQKMNRKHSIEYYRNLIDRILKANNKIHFSSDFIVGFPEESDEDFEQTMSLARDIKYILSYSFKYSPRPGTPSAKKDQIPEYIKSARLTRLQELLFQDQMQFNQNTVNKIVPVFFDKIGREDGQIHGKTKHFQTVLIEGSASLIGKTIDVKIESSTQTCLFGTYTFKQS